MIHFHFIDGTEISTPLEDYPRLKNATNEQRNRWELIGRGVGVHWEDIDEDISIILIGNIKQNKRKNRRQT